jgi:hypothetical protein
MTTNHGAVLAVPAGVNIFLNITTGSAPHGGMPSI